MRSAHQKAVDDLVENLLEEVRLFEEFRSVLEDERSHLIDLDAEGIQQCTRDKERIATRHRLLEESRLAIMPELANLAPSLGHAPTLSELSDVVDRTGLDPDGRLPRLRARLESLVEAVREMNEINTRFVAHSLVCVQGAVSLLQRSAADGQTKAAGTYGSSGRLGPGAQPKPVGGLQVSG